MKGGALAVAWLCFRLFSVLRKYALGGRWEWSIILEKVFLKKNGRTYKDSIELDEKKEPIFMGLLKAEVSDEGARITELWLMFEKELDGGDTSGDSFGSSRGLKKNREGKGADQITFLEYLRMARLYENEKDRLLKRTGYYYPMVEGS